MNDDEIRRGDQADTGARPEDISDVGGADLEDVSDVLEDDDLGDLTVLDASDPALGLTNVAEKGPDDWAADTGPTRSGEAESHGVTNDLAENEVNVDGQRIEFTRSAGQRPGRR